jgi:hypothetical protein
MPVLGTVTLLFSSMLFDVNLFYPHNENKLFLDDIAGKQLIWYGHIERMDPTRLPKIMIHWKPEGRQKRGRPPENLERWNIYSHEWKRSKNG